LEVAGAAAAAAAGTLLTLSLKVYKLIANL